MVTIWVRPTGPAQISLDIEDRRLVELAGLRDVVLVELPARWSPAAEPSVAIVEPAPTKIEPTVPKSESPVPEIDPANGS